MIKEDGTVLGGEGKKKCYFSMTKKDLSFLTSLLKKKKHLLNVTYSSSLLLLGNFNSAVGWLRKKKKLVFATYLEVEQTKENKDSINLLY